MTTFSSKFLLGIGLICATVGQAQNHTGNEAQIHGNFELTSQYYSPDTLIDAAEVPEKIGANGFANIIFTKGNFESGLRYESYQNALQGFQPEYKGNGIPYRYARYKMDGLDVTVGNFYEQFGNGLIFRTYEERALGIDNAMDGVRVKYNPYRGVYFSGIIGKQRLFFDYGEGLVRGIDGEININELSDSLGKMKTNIIIGGSFISKFQKESVGVKLIQPENVGAYAGRINLSRGKFSLMTEYAYKENDPSRDNSYIYRPGQAIYTAASFSQKGLGISLSAKVIDNMSFRSDRNETLTNLMVNYLPASTKQHTYNLAATLYPYATQPNGEFAMQGDMIYTIPRKTKIGGKYGTTISVNYAFANQLDTTPYYNYQGDLNYEKNPLDSTRQGYEVNLFSPNGHVNFKDFNIEVERKFSKKFKLKASYFNFVYNTKVINPGNPNKLNQNYKGMIYADIVVLDGLIKLSRKHSIRIEAQHLRSNQDYKNWATAVIEYTYSPHWFIGLQDQYNYGNDNPDYRIHYPNVTVGYIKNANRISIGYGRQRAGIFCVGGVCRFVPASNGVTLSITSSF